MYSPSGLKSTILPTNASTTTTTTTIASFTTTGGGGGGGGSTHLTQSALTTPLETPVAGRERREEEEEKGAGGRSGGGGSVEPIMGRRGMGNPESSGNIQEDPKRAFSSSSAAALIAQRLQLDKENTNKIPSSVGLSTNSEQEDTKSSTSSSSRSGSRPHRHRHRRSSTSSNSNSGERNKRRVKRHSSSSEKRSREKKQKTVHAEEQGRKEENRWGRESDDGGDAVLSVKSLQERLYISEEWNKRLHHELQELLQLPPADLQACRERIQNIDVSLPLLQRYDAVIQEKDERIDELEGRLQHLQSEVESYLSCEQHLRQDAILRKGLLEKIQQQAEDDKRKEANKIRTMEKKYAELERELCRAVEEREEEGRRGTKAEQTLRSTQQALDRARKEKQDLQDTIEVLRRGQQQQHASQKEDALERETLQLQLQVLLREREDRKVELEQVRSKMVKGLRQAGENHEAHLRVVEERHRLAIEDQRQVSRTHEMEILKLRAQLARVDPNMALFPSSPVSSSPGAGPSTATLLEGQTIQAQDMEIKRLYGELGHAQRQRDDALDRWHELSQRMQEKERGELDDHRREEQGLQRRLHEVRTQLERKEGECTRFQRRLADYKDQVLKLEDEMSEMKMEQHRLTEEVELQKKTIIEKERVIRLTQEDQDRYRGQEGERQGRLQRRVDDVLEELRQSNQQSITDLHNMERERNTLRAQLRETKKELEIVQHELGQRQREREVLDIQMNKLQEGLQKHKEQLLLADNKLIELQRGKEEVERQQRLNILAMEHLKLENSRLQILRRPL